MDVSTDILTSEIRVEKDPESDLIATWVITHVTDGTDGEILLTIDHTELTDITAVSGWMDVKRVAGSQPLPLFDEAVQVIFRDTVTA